MTNVISRPGNATTVATARNLRTRMGNGALASSGILSLIAVWWIGALFTRSDVLASPFAVAQQLVHATYTPTAGVTLLGHAAASLQRWAAGFIAAGVSGVVFGYAFAWWPRFRSALMPIFEVLRYIPPFAWIPLAILWFGAGFTAQAFVVFIAVFPPCVLNAELGARAVDNYIMRASSVLGANRLATLLRVVVPTSLPSAITGLRIGVGNGWMALIGAELIVGRTGLGYVILSGQQNGDAAVVMSGMVTIGLLGALMDRCIRWLASPFIRWRKESDSNGN